MKEAKEYLNDALKLFIAENYHESVDVEKKFSLHKCFMEEFDYISQEIRHAQVDAWNEALDDVIEKIELNWDCYCNMTQVNDEKFNNMQDVWINKQSILKLKIDYEKS